MKVKMKKIFALLIVLVMVFSVSIPVSADELDNPVIPIDDPEPITYNHNFNTVVGNSWQYVIVDSNGFNCNVKIEYVSGFLGVNRIGIKLYSGSTLIYTDWTVSSTTSRTYWCGPDITAIQLCIIDPYGNPVSNVYSATVHIQAPV